jgi:hypothetical protein
MLPNLALPSLDSKICDFSCRDWMARAAMHARASGSWASLNRQGLGLGGLVLEQRFNTPSTWRADPELGKMRMDSIDGGNLLADKETPRTMKHQPTGCSVVLVGTTRMFGLLESSSECLSAACCAHGQRGQVFRMNAGTTNAMTRPSNNGRAAN